MNYTIKKGRSNSTYLFVLTGIFLIISFGYQLYTFLQSNDFIMKLPGDWDKPLGIVIGIILIIRSRRFRNQRLGLFIRIDKKKLIFRTQENQNVQKINLTNIINAYGNEYGITLKTKSNKKININLTAIKTEKEIQVIRKELIQKLND